MLRYTETYWKYKTGFKTRNFDLTIDIIDPLSTKLEQQTRIEKISLVAFLDKEQKKSFANVNRRIKKNNMNYYQNSNLHVTLFGFGPLEKIHNEKIQERLRTFFKNSRTKGLTISLDTIRPGAFYSKNRFSPTNGMGNGTVIAFGNVDTNRFFFNFTNQLTCFLLADKYIRSVLGLRFRRKFPNVWCTLGYYDTNHEFTIGSKLEKLFKQYDYSERKGDDTRFTLSEISLVKSHYKNLRHPTFLEKFKV